MTESIRWALVEDVLTGLQDGEVSRASAEFTVDRMDDGTVLQIDVGDPDLVYVVTVTSFERVD